MKYDVVVIGGGTSGCASAYMLGKYGKKVLLVEKNSFLGGSMTSSLVTPMMKTSENSVNNEFLNIFTDRMKCFNASITYSDGNIGWFNPEIAKIVLDELIKDANVNVLFDSSINSLNISNSYIKKIYLNSKMLSLPIETKYVIDSTGNCDVGFIANCKFLNNNNENQPVSLRFMMSGVDMATFSEWLCSVDKDKSVTSVAKINGQIHLSTAYTWDNGKKWALAPYFNRGVEEGIIKDEDRNYFQLFTVPNMRDTVAFNCPRIYFKDNINPLNPNDYSKALIKGRESILRLSEFCKKYFKGFENAYISNIADSLGIRVSRRIKGKYVYTIEDLKSGKKFNNPAVISNYPVDVHSGKKDNSVLEHTMQEYQLPIESLMSKDIENLFVIGRCLSADFYSQGALRIIPSCFSMGVAVAKFLKNLV